jgi:hypothetical protein
MLSGFVLGFAPQTLVEKMKPDPITIESANNVPSPLNGAKNHECSVDPRQVCATEHIKRIWGSGSQPHLMRCSDGHYYVVKFANNPQGGKTLFNDLFATRLAAMLGLPVAASSVIFVNRELISYGCDMDVGYGSRTLCQAGPCFGSRYPSQPGRAKFCHNPSLGEIENAPDFLGMLVFDKWTCNIDQRQVLFVQRRKKPTCRALMIDQGFCFNGTWAFRETRFVSRYSDPDVYRSVRGIESFNRWLTRLDKINENMIAEAARGIPPEWHGETGAAIESLIEQLDRRRSKVRELIWSTHKFYKFYKSNDIFPNWPPSISTRAAYAWAGD